MISCNALREVRTLCWVLDVNTGVKNFLKRLGVTVGGFIGFFGTLSFTEQAGEETEQFGSVSDIAIEIGGQAVILSSQSRLQKCSSRWNVRSFTTPGQS